MNTFLEELYEGLTLTEQRELSEELFALYSPSSKDRKLYYSLLENYSSILNQLNYEDRQESLNKVIETVKKRHGNPEKPNPADIIVNTKGHLSKLKHGSGAWVGVDFFPEWNNSRLLALRLQKLADAIAQALNSDALKNSIDKANPAISLLGIVWYIPRFFRHTALIIKHTKKSGNLDYARKHAFEWFNDLAWLVTGAMTFGMSTGLYLAPLTSALGPGGIYLTVALYGFDCLNQAIKSHQKIQKMNRILNKLDSKINQLYNDLDDYNLNRNLSSTDKIKQIEQVRNNELQWVKQRETRLKQYAKVEQFDSSTLKKEYEKLHHKKQNLTKLNKLSSALEMRERIKLRKRYTKREQWSKLGISAGLFIGMAVSLIGGPTAPVIGSAIVLATCAIQHYANNYYLPKEEIRFSYDPLEELHNRLTKHCEGQIEKLTLALHEIEPNSKEYDRSEHKLNRYAEMQSRLKDWQDADIRKTDELFQTMQRIIETSQLQRKRNIEPASAKELKNILRVFDIQWETKKYDLNIENQFRKDIRAFIDITTYRSPANYFKEPPRLLKTNYDQLASY
ncbi:hypothetical protein L3V82_01960 [Thiotrichales bacterium 19S3-7]|nr:hypothetical protein [Thiotrichales bacterium 19S3-7]MCF6800930.1 hypothetical protein [Thiotrichales bacterium 19S3-11]